MLAAATQTARSSYAALHNSTESIEAACSFVLQRHLCNFSRPQGQAMDQEQGFLVTYALMPSPSSTAKFGTFKVQRPAHDQLRPRDVRF